MRILHISTSDQGGAAKACLRLHKGFLQQSVNSKVLLKNKTNNEISGTYKISHHAIERSFKTKLNTKAVSILKELNLYKAKPDPFLLERPAGLEMFSYPFSKYDITKSDLYKQSDIINLHWVANFLDYPSFFKKNKKPIVWTLHDQNPFLGLEHYSETIVGVDEKGYPIKRELSKFERSKFKQFEDIKKQALNTVENLTVVTPSEWLGNEAKNSPVFENFDSKVIPYGLNSDIFKTLNKTFCREFLNIPEDKTVMLFVADSISNKRKGYEYLQKALKQIKKNCVLLSVGSKQSQLNQKDNYLELGRIQDERLMSIIYSAADVFVIPSLMDNLPNTVLESIMCGTPVIGFPVGGIPDMIQGGENGYLTEEISVPALVKVIEIFLSNPNVFDLKKIRENAVKKYSLSVQAKAYKALYTKLLH
ncbi:glycosyltransferase [Rhodohalobacter sp. 8-1]|uniref:glycosyltransferase n=1 Tax=Rhodohalobacter sp. 8-1 TaxID=3131972 RepID=UPI0030EF073F